MWQESFLTYRCDRLLRFFTFKIARGNSMADLQITDEFGFSATLQLQDASPLAKAKIAHLSCVDQALKDEIDKPLDQTSLKGFSFGVDYSAPNTTIANVAKISANAGVCGVVSIVKPAAKTLFQDENFAPIPVAANQCWIGVEFGGRLAAKLALFFQRLVKDVLKLHRQLRI